MNSLQQSDDTQVALRLRSRSRLQAATGVIGLGAGGLLVAPKLALLAAGNLEVIGVGLIANLALVFGSLMFLRNAQQMRREN
jgi:hypothetical protein